MDLQPAGWRLTDGSGREHRQALSTLRSDLDQLEEHAQGYAGPVKYAVAGPWTLAATVERPRGDRALADHGARRELGQSLAEGIAELVADMRRRLPEAQPVVQLDEPMLPAVLAGRVATASGFSRHRTIEPSEVSTALRYVVERADTRSWCTAVPPTRRWPCCGAPACRASWWTPTDWTGRPGTPSAAPSTPGSRSVWAPCRPVALSMTPDEIARRVLNALRDLGVEPTRSGQLLLTPACGLAGANPDGAVRALRAVRAAADIVTDRLAS